MTKYRGIDFRRYDSRIVSLQTIIIGLDNSILTLKRKVDEIDYYDGVWLLEELEPIFGLAFIAFQNYINSSIYDRFEELEKQHLKYKRGNKVNFSGRTEIELIITLANYSKERQRLSAIIDFMAQILSSCVFTLYDIQLVVPFLYRFLTAFDFGFLE